MFDVQKSYGNYEYVRMMIWLTLEETPLTRRVSFIELAERLLSCFPKPLLTASPTATDCAPEKTYSRLTNVIQQQV